MALFEKLKAAKAEKTQQEQTTKKTQKARKRAQMHEDEHVVTLVSKTKEPLKELDCLKGELYVKGKYEMVFTEQDPAEAPKGPGSREWENHVTLAESANGRISANANGVFFGLYFKDIEFEDQQELIEEALEQMEKMCVKALRKDIKQVIAECRAKKPKEAKQ